MQSCGMQGFNYCDVPHKTEGSHQAAQRQVCTRDPLGISSRLESLGILAGAEFWNCYPDDTYKSKGTHCKEPQQSSRGRHIQIVPIACPTSPTKGCSLIKPQRLPFLLPLSVLTTMSAVMTFHWPTCCKMSRSCALVNCSGGGRCSY